MPVKLEVRPVTRLFKALADENRLRIVALLSRGELCVCHLQEALQLPQPNVSRQLAILRSAGVVEDRRAGSWVYYGLREQDDPDSARQMEGLVRRFAKDAEIRREIERVRHCTGPSCC
jgi:ArsR family transcriptional regulator